MYTVLVIHIKEPYGREAQISGIFIDGKPPKLQLWMKCAHCILYGFQLNRFSKFCIKKTDTYIPTSFYYRVIVILKLGGTLLALTPPPSSNTNRIKLNL